MSGAQTSGFPNVLFNAPAAYQAAQQYQDNQLLMQQHQQQIGAADTEMAARIAGTLSDPSAFPTIEARAAAYPGLVAQARANGYRLPHAPDTYPGDAQIAATARLGTPSAELYKQGVDRTAKGAIAPGDGGTTGTGTGGTTTGGGGTGGGGGGTGTVGGTDTAPINAAGDSRTRKAAEGGPPAAGSPGDAVAQRTHDFWRSKGFSEEQTAGIMAGGPGSESDFTPTAGGDKVNGVATSIGLYQHHGPRLHNAQGTGLLDRYGPNPTADQQNEYAYWEITQGPLKNVGAMLNNAKTPAEAAAIWTQYFGVPADKTEIGRRALGANRYLGRYAGQPGAPGASTAPAVVTGDVGRPGDVPPSPGGAPGAYPAYGGGMGAAIGGQPAAARATIPAGRPTGPPVITDQPAGSNVVAGPPGVATVGAPQPPGPAVAGNVAAINAGITGAGGQPVTDPNLTPTPARYAGTAPAPSVEAAPEAGWGTGIGSGYGPQNALAPAPVQPAPARPAVPAAQQPPAADTLPPLPVPTPPEPTNRNNLTDRQQKAIDALRPTSITSKELQAEADRYSAANTARAEKYQADQMAYLQEVRLRQGAAETARHTAVEEARQVAADKLAQEKAAREAADAAKLQLSKSDEADAERVLMAIGPKVRAGTELTPAEADQYDIARRRYARGPLQQVPDGKGGTITAFVGQEVPDRFPPLPGQKEYAGLKPIPGTEKQPDFAPANAMTAMLDIGEGNRKIVRALDSLEAYPGGVGVMRGSQPNVMSNWTDPEGVKVRADIGLVQGAIYHNLAGTAQSAQETQRLRSFVPGATDNAEAAKVKLRNMLDNNRETLLDHYRAFGPDAGGRRVPAVEEEILSTIPEAAVDRLRQEPKTAKEFDKKFGRGAAKLVLQNG